MSERMSSWLLLGARVLLSPIFIMSGAMKIMEWSATAEQMESEGMVAVPFFLAAAIAVELIGGLSLLLGFKARWGALLLAMFLIPVSLIFHDFWTYQGQQMMNQMQHFTKNMTIIGGLLGIVAAGAGRYAVDAWLTMSSRRDIHVPGGLAAAR